MTGTHNYNLLYKDIRGASPMGPFTTQKKTHLAPQLIGHGPKECLDPMFSLSQKAFHISR